MPPPSATYYSIRRTICKFFAKKIPTEKFPPGPRSVLRRRERLFFERAQAVGKMTLPLSILIFDKSKFRLQEFKFL